jgi:hypothetical protein
MGEGWNLLMVEFSCGLSINILGPSGSAVRGLLMISIYVK